MRKRDFDFDNWDLAVDTTDTRADISASWRNWVEVSFTVSRGNNLHSARGAKITFALVAVEIEEKDILRICSLFFNNRLANKLTASPMLCLPALSTQRKKEVYSKALGFKSGVSLSLRSMKQSAKISNEAEANERVSKS